MCAGAWPPPVTPAPNLTLFQEEFDQDVDALLEEGLPVAKKRRLAEDKFAGDSDHASDGEEGSVQPMMTKIKTVLKSECRLGSGFCRTLCCCWSTTTTTTTLAIGSMLPFYTPAIVTLYICVVGLL